MFNKRKVVLTIAFVTAVALAVIIVMIIGGSTSQPAPPVAPEAPPQIGLSAEERFYVEVLAATGQFDIRGPMPQTQRCGALDTRPSEGWLLCAYELPARTGVNDSGETVITEQAYTRLGYAYVSSITHFASYVSVSVGSGWPLTPNLNDKPFPRGETAEVVLFWNDPARPRTDAPLPFGWEQVVKPVR